MATVKLHEKFPNVYWVTSDEGEKFLATKNLAPRVQVYGERLFRIGGEEFRAWSPYRSKLSAAIWNKVKEIYIKPGCSVLYLGTATGTTASHVSDIIDEKGILYGVDFAPRVMIQFKQNVVQYRKNVIPIYADARKPRDYSSIVGKVDVIYCDVAQPEQAKILVENSKLMLKNGGHGIIAIKARSIDSVEDPEIIFKKEAKVLEDNSFKILEIVNLEPYEKDHVLVIVEY
ncbi:MAG: fibrillarin-like rRNA/tRNA 2'-O-methyltransferase [Aigarchaeota archaeon]|nr:fibrillarin-like rRNA/tRNA 2'-O-methyltransferase [Aigarchaeota archaeon]MDW7986810.1 fibrillarin-like rRNA/tRNA 2'-O-methyltransferase [Nitrososphaerota archaeon]